MSNPAAMRASRSSALTIFVLLTFLTPAAALHAQQPDVGIVGFGGVAPGGVAPETLAITADVLPATASVRFFLNGMALRVDNGVPFAWFGRIAGQPFAIDTLMLLDGEYTVSAIAYPLPNGQGTPSAAASITFTVDNAERRAFLLEQLMAIFTGAPPPIPPAQRSFDLNGVDEYFANLEGRPLSVAGDFTVTMWLKPAAIDHRFDLFRMVDPNGTLANGVFAWVEGDRPGRPLRVSASDLDGRLLRNQSYNNRLVTDEWIHVAFAHRQSGRRAILVWFDGVFRDFSSRIVGSGGPIEDAPRDLWIGAGPDLDSGLYRGAIGHVAIFDRVLNGAQLSEIVAGGHGFDLRQDFGDYVSSDALVHYWRPGWLTDEPLRDFADLDPIDLIDSAGIDADNLVDDAPPVSAAAP